MCCYNCSSFVNCTGTKCPVAEKECANTLNKIFPNVILDMPMHIDVPKDKYSKELKPLNQKEFIDTTNKVFTNMTFNMLDILSFCYTCCYHKDNIRCVHYDECKAGADYWKPQFSNAIVSKSQEDREYIITCPHCHAEIYHKVIMSAVTVTKCPNCSRHYAAGPYGDYLIVHAVTKFKQL